ncbi:protein kinase domain-containing protein [Spirulina subsalsa]|uniref:protein kinase domain-containing protein n=1 Tax=Spirulina subsalsa TaxID=54311 RepID=UPI0003094F76|nr:protein kinase family protein [Spirulina subsalsa]
MVQPQQPNLSSSSLSSGVSVGDAYANDLSQSQGVLQTLTPERQPSAAHPPVVAPEIARPTQRYQMLQELGQPIERGCITYLAQDTITQQKVVIKHFEAAEPDGTVVPWQALKQQIQRLQTVNHPQLLTYQYGFPTPTEKGTGFCWVRNYIDNCQPLHHKKELSFAEIKTVFLKLLDLLSELHQQTPVILHQNLKPENILLDDQLNLYLVDLGWHGQSEPDELENPRGDLRAVGLAWLSWFSQTPWEEMPPIGDRLTLSPLAPKLSTLNPDFVQWLESLVNPNPPNPYQSAHQARTALERLSLARVPEIPLELPPIVFKAHHTGQVLNQSLRLKRGLPPSLIEGTWEIAPHADDPPHSGAIHPWIRVSPAHFDPEQRDYQITIDPRHLTLGESYERQIILHQYSAPEIKYTLTLQVQLVPAKPSLKDWIQARLPKYLPRPFFKPANPLGNLSEEEIRLALTRYGSPDWTEEDFQQLLKVLGEAGYGWLNPEGIRQQLEIMSQHYKS